MENNYDLSRDSIYKLSLVSKKLKAEEFCFIKSWPSHLIESTNDFSMLFVHGSPADFTNGYVYPDTELGQFDVSSNFVFMGHTHYPFIRKNGNVCYVNVGSCGMPRDDGRFGSSVIFDPKTGDVRVVRYDITSATKEVFIDAPFVHDTVKANFDRRRDSIYGEIIN